MFQEPEEVEDDQGEGGCRRGADRGGGGCRGDSGSWSEVIASNVVLTVLGKEEWRVGHAVEYTRVGEDAAKVLAAVDSRELPFVQMQVLLDWSQARRRIVGWDGEARLVKTECFGGPAAA